MEYNSVKNNPLLKQHVIYCGRHAALANPDLSRTRCVISISDNDAELFEVFVVFALNEHGVLRLKFSDLDRDEPGAITLQQAQSIIEFIDDHDNCNFLVHCFVGASRSAAIAKFIVEYLELDDSDTANLKYYNEYVYNTLKSLV